MTKAERPPVLVLPGFGAGDVSTIGLRSSLALSGYRVHRWHLGRNDGPSAELMAGLYARLLALVERHDQPIAIVGWSLGGVYGWNLASRYPAKVQQVVTLGSPLRSMVDTSHPATVPLTSIWSRHDRIVSWENSSIDERSLRENVEVRSTHLTLGLDPLVMRAISDRLGQERNDWKPFRPPLWLSHAYPNRRTG